jgi:hypothetical protein
MMHEAGLCRSAAFPVLVQHSAASSIIQVNDVSFHDIWVLAESFILPRIILPSSIGEEDSNLTQSCRNILLAFGQVHTSATCRETAGVFFTLGLASYLWSHCTVNREEYGTESGSVIISDTASDNQNHTTRFRCRKLACLDSFIGSYVWVFDSTGTMQGCPAALSVTLEQFADLGAL